MARATLDAETVTHRPVRRGRRGVRWAGLAVLTAAAVAAYSLMNRGPEPPPPAALPPGTTTIARETLTDTLEADGELGYGPSTSVVNRMRGTITWLPGSGDVITRGKPRVDPEDRRPVKEGARVTVTLPGGDAVRGRVTEVATVIEAGKQNEEPRTEVEALVSLPAKKARDLDEASVDVTFTADKREDVLTVPITALVALREGGFGVEVVENGRTRYVPVETGLFSGGRVEISGPGLAEGMTVGMAK